MEALSLELAKAQKIPTEVCRDVITEAVESVLAEDYLAEGGVDYARSVLMRSLGEDRADEIIGRLAATIERRPFEFLRRTPAEQIVVFLRNESPQTIALVVSNLHTTLAAQVLSDIDPEIQADVALRIALMAETRPEVVSQVENVMRSRLSAVGSQEYAAAGGVKSLADILNSSDRTTERNVLDELAKADGELAEEIRLLLFTFEDVVKLDDRSIQMVLKEVDQKDLAIALRGVNEDVRGQDLREHVRAWRRAPQGGDPVPAAAAQARRGRGAGPHRRCRASPRGGRRDRDLPRWRVRRGRTGLNGLRRRIRLRDARAARAADGAGRPGRRRHGRAGRGARRGRPDPPPGAGRGLRRGSPRGARGAARRPWPRWPPPPRRSAPRRRAAAEALERRAVELGLALAQKVLAGALSVEPERVLDSVQGALRGIVERERVIVMVNPEDLEIVRGATEELQGLARRHRALRDRGRAARRPRRVHRAHARG